MVELRTDHNKFRAGKIFSKSKRVVPFWEQLNPCARYWTNILSLIVLLQLMKVEMRLHIIPARRGTVKPVL
jgi:hypothetical protein